MDSIYNKYRMENDVIVANREKTIEFFTIFKKMSKADYEGRVAIMKELYGELKDLPVTYYYGDFCSITIFKENEQYKFTFDCKKGNLNDIAAAFPELAEEIDKVGYEQLKLQKPELFTSQENSGEVSLKDDFYINLYRNLNINKGKQRKDS